MVKTKHTNEIFSLCAQWARIYGPTCGPVGQKFPPTGLEVAFTYSEFQRGQSQPKGKIFWHQWCRSCGSHRSPGRRSSQVVGNEIPQKTTPYENFFTLRPLVGKFLIFVAHWSTITYRTVLGKKRNTFLKKVSLLTYRTLFIKKRTPFRKNLNAPPTYLIYRNIEAQNEPLFVEKEIFFWHQLRLHWQRRWLLH